MPSFVYAVTVGLIGCCACCARPKPAETVDFLARPRSSAGQSNGFLNRRSGVRVSPGAPFQSSPMLAGGWKTYGNPLIKLFVCPGLFACGPQKPGSIGGHIGGHIETLNRSGPQMALTDTTIRTAKPREKPYKVADEKGLFLLVQPSGGKLWRLKYRFNGKEMKLALGRYPNVALKQARVRCEEARKLIASGIDPAVEKKQAKAAAVLSSATTFKSIADEYIDKTQREGRAVATVAKSRWVLALMEPALGARPISEIVPPELLAVLKKMEARGNLETARRTRAFASRVFRYAVATGRASADPAASLQGALTAPIRKHHGAILEAKRVGELLRAIDGYDGQPITQLALNLPPTCSSGLAKCVAPNGGNSTWTRRCGRYRATR